DGIRDRTVTGVQTCALPIWPPRVNAPDGAQTALSATPPPTWWRGLRGVVGLLFVATGNFKLLFMPGGPTAFARLIEQIGFPAPRSEERRVGKGCGERAATAS